MQFTSRNQVFAQLVINTTLSNLKIVSTLLMDLVAVARPVKFKAWPPSPLLLGMAVLF